MLTGDGQLVNVVQGDYAISDTPEAVLTTVLGSCIAVCLMDRARHIGGMNHFLLPESDGRDRQDVRYGAHAMELLINGLLKQGAQRERLEAKVFGGARMIGTLRDIGASNARFALRFLTDEGIACLAQSTGGTSARRIRFWPATGLVRQRVVDAPVDTARPPDPVPPSATTGKDIILF